MKYLTHDWWHSHGRFDDQSEYQENRKVAEGEFDQIKESLPEGLRDFMRFYRSTLARLEIDIDQGVLEMTLLGSLRGEVNEFYPVRYEIRLTGVSRYAVIPNSKYDVQEAWWGAFGDYGFGEFELVGDGLIKWDMLFANRIELSVTFRDASVQVIPRASRDEGMPSRIEDIRRVRRRRGRRSVRSQL